MMRAQNTALARFYGLPKVNNEGTPPGLSYDSKVLQFMDWQWLFRRLNFLTPNSATTVSSSTQLLGKGVSLLSRGVMVSFDVMSFFVAIPRSLTVETIELILRDKYYETENRPRHAQLLKFCLKLYFKFDGKIYEQVKGTPMGSPITGLIAEAVL
ncbi:unnamed protein product [Schistocephalus solidus]|uniref:Reverse transcriptase domain-containing protein n=1 Tax=Schistocephalus solidus TaxID=70667 RepID=A0A183T4E6_SCHSO|nr:unnamed protein product [Schistocephalus solidus]